MYSDDRGLDIREVTGLTYISKGELYAEKAEEFRSGETAVTSVSEITHSSDSLTIGRAAEIRVSDFLLYNIEGFKKRGDEIYIEKGDLVIDGANYYFNIKDSFFHFKGGRIMKADVTSSKDNNSMLVRGTSILADKDMGFKADFWDEVEITSKNSILPYHN